MAHIPDGVLSGEVLLAGAVVAAVGVGWGLKRLEPARIPQVAVLSAVFFVASLVHIPAGPSSVHLMLNGLAGIALGPAAFPAILVALALQAVLFGFGGLLPLGVNLTDMAVPAVLAGFAFAKLKSGEPRRDGLLAGGLAAMAVLATAGMVAGALALSGREFLPAARLVVLTYLPVAVVEAVFTAAAVGLMSRVRPGMLGAGALAAMLLFAAPPAEAHRLKLFAAVDGGAITGQAYFAGGGPAVELPGRLLNPDGSEAGAFRTDAEGRFAVTPSARQDYTLAVDAGDGHAASFKLPAAELPHSLPLGQASPPVAAEVPPPELARLVEDAVARQVRPLREQLDAYEAKTRLHDVLGGIGTILGVFGLAAFAAARRKAP